MSAGETTAASALTAEQARARLAEIAPRPGGEASASEIALWLSVRAVRAYTRHVQPYLDCETDRAPDSRAVALLRAEWALAETLETLVRAELPVFAEDLADTIGSGWHEDTGAFVLSLAVRLGADVTEVTRLERRLMELEAASGQQDSAETTLDFPDAGLRGVLKNAMAALAGDNEGIRLWMLDCASLVQRHRDRADAAEQRRACAELCAGIAALNGTAGKEDS